MRHNVNHAQSQKFVVAILCVVHNMQSSQHKCWHWKHWCGPMCRQNKHWQKHRLWRCAQRKKNKFHRWRICFNQSCGLYKDKKDVTDKVIAMVAKAFLEAHKLPCAVCTGAVSITAVESDPLATEDNASQTQCQTEAAATAATTETQRIGISGGQGS